MKVLVIEDDPDVSDTIISVLNGFYENVLVDHISDGDKFRRGAWKDKKWDLVVLDLMIPGMTGFEVCEEIRAHPQTKKVPIFALTGYDTLQNEKKIKAAGATSYMAKPFEVSNFIEAVNKIIK